MWKYDQLDNSISMPKSQLWNFSKKKGWSGSFSSKYVTFWMLSPIKDDSIFSLILLHFRSSDHLIGKSDTAAGSHEVNRKIEHREAATKWIGKSLMQPLPLQQILQQHFIKPFTNTCWHKINSVIGAAHLNVFEISVHSLRIMLTELTRL